MIDLAAEYPLDLGSGVRAAVVVRDGKPAWVGLAVHGLERGGRTLPLEAGGVTALTYWRLASHSPLTLEGPPIELGDGRLGHVRDGLWRDESL